MLIVVKGSLFIDIDGTIVNDTTEEALPEAVEKINQAYENGFMIILTTFRGENWEVTNRFSKVNTMRLLKILGLKYHVIIWDSPSPRIIMNDDVVGSIQHPLNGSWEKYEFI